MSIPKISFVVPVYNKEAYVADCLNALVTQTLKDIEIICVDDGSTDSSLKVMKWYEVNYPEVRVFDLTKNMGRSYARNFGNTKARANIICVQDADDISAPARAEKIYTYLKTHPKIDIVYSEFYVSDAFGNVNAKMNVFPFDIDRVKETTGTQIGHSTMAYRNKGLKYSSGKWSDLGIDDWKFQLDAYKKGHKFGYIQEPLLVYRIIDGTVSDTRDRKEVKKIKEKYLKTI